jgi:uncharacterized protein DUF2442
VRKGSGEAVFNVEGDVELRNQSVLRFRSCDVPRRWQMNTERLLFEGGMNTLVDQPVAAFHRNGKIYVTMQSGMEIAFPVRGNPRLEGKSDEQLNRIELSPFGLHWPDLDEDLSIKGILAGNFGQRAPQAA